MGFNGDRLILPASCRIANLTECIIERETGLRGLPSTDKFVWFAWLQGNTRNVTTVGTISGLVDDSIQVIDYRRCDKTLSANVVELSPDEPAGRKSISNRDRRKKAEVLDLY